MSTGKQNLCRCKFKKKTKEKSFGYKLYFNDVYQMKETYNRS